MKLRKYIKEATETEFETSMQQFANLVGKGGKYSHRPTAQFIAKAYGYKEGKEDINVKKVMDDLEDWNYHTEYAILDALANGRKKDAEILVMIAEEHLKIGHIPYDLSQLRSYISNRKSYEKYQKMGISNGGKISQSTMKILKKMDKKDADKFMELFLEE